MAARRQGSFASGTPNSVEDMSADAFLAVQLAETPENNNGIRPALADDRKVGFFSLDRATQTEDTEIIDMKHMTEAVHKLLEEADQMKRDISFARNVMHADFEAKLHQKSIDLYVRVNDKISEIEKMHEDRVATVRRAFKQQLADAISRVHTLYNGRDIDKRMDREKQRREAAAGKWEVKARELQATVQQQESVIELLKQQIQDLREEQDTRSKTPAFYIDESQLEELREEIADRDKKIRKLELALETSSDNTRDLNNEIDHLQNQLEKERIMIEQIKQEHQEAWDSAEASRAAADRQAANQRLNAGKELEDRVRQAREQAYDEARKQLAQIQEQDRERIKQLMEERRLMEQKFAEELALAKEKPKEQLDVEKARETERRLLTEINKLKKEIERVHRTWEKKFAVLQQSLHALKDESFLRQTMQRQAAQLHQASISFAYDTPQANTREPVSRSYPQAPTGGQKKPLPEIGRQTTDFMSYTVSAPSGRGTTLFSTDENQVMSDTEQEIPAEFNPLPPPPNRQVSDCREDSRQETTSRGSNKSHIVVLPSVQAQ